MDTAPRTRGTQARCTPASRAGFSRPRRDRGYIQGAPGEPFKYWYISWWPGIAIVVFVLAWNLLGDAYRDVFDPRDA